MGQPTSRYRLCVNVLSKRFLLPSVSSPISSRVDILVENAGVGMGTELERSIVLSFPISLNLVEDGLASADDIVWRIVELASRTILGGPPPANAGVPKAAGSPPKIVGGS